MRVIGHQVDAAVAATVPVCSSMSLNAVRQTPILQIRYQTLCPQTKPVTCFATNTAAAVLVKDRTVAEQAPATPQELLTRNREWSYTTALVRDAFCVIDWELHLERLLRNIKVLSQQELPVYSNFTCWIQQKGHTDADVLEALAALINPQVAQALQLLSQTQQQDRVMLVVVLTEQQAQQSTGSSGPPLSVMVYAKPAPPSDSAPAKVLVAGDPRPAARAKHCNWVITRQPLEQLRQQAAVDEVVLSSSAGDLLEGLACNWFVIADEAHLLSSQAEATCQSIASTAAASAMSSAGQPAAAVVYGLQQVSQLDSDQEGSSSDSGSSSSQPDFSSTAGLVLLTTSPADAALLGVTQQRVLEAAAAVGLKVLQRPSKLQHHGCWREAFITNCLRGIHPVNSVLDATGSTVWTMASGHGCVTAQLQHVMRRLQVITDMRQYL